MWPWINYFHFVKLSLYAFHERSSTFCPSPSFQYFLPAQHLWSPFLLRGIPHLTVLILQFKAASRLRAVNWEVWEPLICDLLSSVTLSRRVYCLSFTSLICETMMVTSTVKSVMGRAGNKALNTEFGTRSFGTVLLWWLFYFQHSWESMKQREITFSPEFYRVLNKHNRNEFSSLYVNLKNPSRCPQCYWISDPVHTWLWVFFLFGFLPSKTHPNDMPALLDAAGHCRCPSVLFNPCISASSMALSPIVHSRILNQIALAGF